MATGNTEHEGHHVKRVVLPSGKTIEVVYFETERESAAREPAMTAAPESAEQALHVCRECASELVYPIQWEEAGPEYWRVALRCPNCEWEAAGVFSQGLVDRFDEQLDLGTEQLVDDFKTLMQANMSEEIERFVTALDADAILPEDF